MNKIKYLIISIICFSTQITFAAECVITLVKAECWKGYQLDLNITKSDGMVLGNISIAKDKSWGRTSFPCNSGDVLASNISFDPPLWQNEAGKRYSSGRFWSLPSNDDGKDNIYAIQMCFPKDFAKLPVSPNTGIECDCNIQGIPPVKNENVSE